MIYIAIVKADSMFYHNGHGNWISSGENAQMYESILDAQPMLLRIWKNYNNQRTYAKRLFGDSFHYALIDDETDSPIYIIKDDMVTATLEQCGYVEEQLELDL